MSLVDSFTCESWIAIQQVEVAPGSGDCIHVVTRADGKALFFLADVAGHDRRAAQFARILDGLVSELALAMSPGALLTTLNAAIEACWPPDLFVTAVCFSLDPSTGSGSIAVAGQLPPVAKGWSSTRPVQVDGGPALGIFAGQIYEQQPLEVAAGELLVATTDGVTDPLATRNDVLGLSRLSRIVNEATFDPADACRALLRSIRGAKHSDDATALAIAPARHGFEGGTRGAPTRAAA
jgi:phosphoserine phosphatase RsbU/P